MKKEGWWQWCYFMFECLFPMYRWVTGIVNDLAVFISGLSLFSGEVAHKPITCCNLWGETFWLVPSLGAACLYKICLIILVRKCEITFFLSKNKLSLVYLSHMNNVIFNKLVPGGGVFSFNCKEFREKKLIFLTCNAVKVKTHLKLLILVFVPSAWNEKTYLLL